jgi:hypothetical protein
MRLLPIAAAAAVAAAAGGLYLGVHRDADSPLSSGKPDKSAALSVAADSRSARPAPRSSATRGPQLAAPGSNRPSIFPSPPGPGEPRPSDGEIRQAILQNLAATGPAQSWGARAPAVFASFQEAIRTAVAPAPGAAAPSVELSPTRCYAGGCVATARYASFGDYTWGNESLPQTAGFQGWPGPKFRSPPEQFADGRVEADWILLPPDAPADPSQERASP